MDLFRKSSFCAAAGCVAVAHVADMGLALRSTVTPEAGTLVVSSVGRAGLLTAIKADRLDWPSSAD